MTKKNQPDKSAAYRWKDLGESSPQCHNDHTVLWFHYHLISAKYTYKIHTLQQQLRMLNSIVQAAHSHPIEIHLPEELHFPSHTAAQRRNYCTIGAHESMNDEFFLKLTSAPLIVHCALVQCSRSLNPRNKARV